MPRPSVVIYKIAGFLFLLLPVVSGLSGSVAAAERTEDSLSVRCMEEVKGIDVSGYSRDCRSVSQSLARVAAKNPVSAPAAFPGGPLYGSEIFRAYLEAGADDGSPYIYGRVIDSDSGEPVVMATVSIGDTGRTTITDSRGFFRMESGSNGEEVPIGVEHIAYDGVTRMAPSGPELLVIPVSKMLYRAPVVNVSGSRKEEPGRLITFDRPGLGERSLSRSAFSQVDPVHALKENPVLSSSSDFDGRFSIHGSSPDANAFFLDGLLFPSPYHLGGLCSIYDPSNVGSFSFSRAPYSASSFGATGAVVEVQTRDGMSHSPGNTFSVGVLSSSISSRNSAGGIYGSLLARRSYMDLIYNSLDTGGSMKIPNFYDLQTSVVKHLSPDYYLKLGLILSGDNTEMEAEQFVSGSGETPVLSWHRGMNAVYLVFGGKETGRKWIPTGTIGWQPYSFRFDISGSDDESMRWSGGRASFRIDLERGYSRGRLRAGLYAASSGIDYDLQFGRGFWLASRNENSAVRADADGWEFLNRGYMSWSYSAGYAEFTRAGGTAALRAGLRLEHFSGSDLFLSPSATLISEISDKTVLSLSGGIFARDTRDDFGNPASAGSRAGVEKAAEITAALRQDISGGISAEISGFLRRDWDLLVETEPVHFENTGRGRGYGFDAGIEKVSGGWTGMVKYAYTRSERKDGRYTLSFRPDRRDENAGMIEPVLVPSYWYRSPYQRRHSLLLEGARRITDNLKLIMKWSCSSGKPYTPVGYVEEVAPGRFAASEGRKMSSTLPPYSRLDLRVEWKYGRSVVFAEVMNLTNNSNYFNFRYNRDYTRKHYYRSLSVVPAFGVNIHF